ncbi:hypothetical protein CLOP_g15087 [Closterium sp. NIES-67]|nr:hypothetical protein CLOP_g15087 [Closterium sp. NIES-67]
METPPEAVPPKTVPAKIVPPKIDPPKTVPPKIDPPKTVPPKIVPISLRIAEIAFAAGSIGLSVKLTDRTTQNPTLLLNMTLAIAALCASVMLLSYIPTSSFAYLHTTRANLLLQVIESNIFMLVILAAGSAQATAITDSYGLNCGGSSACLVGRACNLLAMLTWLTFVAACWYFAVCLYMLPSPMDVPASSKTAGLFLPGGKKKRKKNIHWRYWKGIK